MTWYLFFIPVIATVLVQVDRMVTDAEKFSEQDKKQREAVDIRNSVRTACLPHMTWLFCFTG